MGKSELNETRSSSSSQVENRISQDKIQQLSDQKEALTTKLEIEQDNTKSLVENIESSNRRVFSVRQDMASHGGVNASLDHAKAVQKQIRILENRLDKALQKFNEAIAANRALREQIDTLRRGRVVFYDIYRKLENELQQKKK